MKETIAKINQTKSWFFEKINKSNKPLARLIKKKRETTQINKIRNEKGKVTTDNAEIQRIIRDYYEQLYGNKMDNLEEMDRFLEKFNLPRLRQEEIEILNNPITSTEIEAVNKHLPKNKSSRPDGEFCQTFREELIPVKTLSKNCRGRNISKLILRGHHHCGLISKPKTTQRKLEVNVTDEHRCKNPQQNFNK